MRRPSRLVRVVTSAGAIASIVGLTVAILAVRGHAGEGHRNTGWTELTSGTYAGVEWRLDASVSDGRLCLELDGPHGPGDPADESNGYPGACGFDDKFEGTTFYAGGLGPAHSSIVFGPVPENATVVRVATHRVVPTHRLPTGKGLPRGRYWFDIVPSDWPHVMHGDGTPLAVPQPLDASGKPVSFRSF